MDLKKREYLLLRTESGQIGWTLGLWFVLFLGILLCALLQIETLRASAHYMEDALAASNLAAAVIDVEEYGISHRLQIDSAEEAYIRYQRAIMGNLNLNENWECGSRGLISGPVHIENFTVYNVNGSEVDVRSFGGDGTVAGWQGILGQETAPNGKKVENTGIYSEISYRVRGLFGLNVMARKGKLADVARM